MTLFLAWLLLQSGALALLVVAVEMKAPELERRRKVQSLYPAKLRARLSGSDAPVNQTKGK